MKKAQGIKPRDVLPGLQVIRDIYNLPRIPVDSEGECLCYYCEKHVKRARREKFFKLPRYVFFPTFHHSFLFLIPVVIKFSSHETLILIQTRSLSSKQAS